MLYRIRILLAILACGFVSSALAADRDLLVRVDMVGEEIRTYVSIFVPASQERVWDVLTDYEKEPAYLSDLHVSKIVSRSGDRLRVFQKASVRFGPFTFPIETLRDIRLVAPVRMESRLVSGTMTKYDSTIELQPEGAGTRIIIRSQAIAGSALAALAGESFVKRETEDHFRQVRAEILRREQIASRQ